MTDAPQIYLLTPPEIGPGFPDRLARLMDAAEVGCLRLAAASRDEDLVVRAADALLPVAHEREVALLIDDHAALVPRLGLDGVHLTDGSRSVADIRRALGGDVVIGAHCGASRHDGMSAGERGADYVAFGPVGETALGHGERAPRDLFEWWFEMIEVPVVAEGVVDAQAVERLAPFVDWIALGEEIWRHDDPSAALRTITAPLR